MAKHQQTKSTSTGNSNEIRKQLDGTIYCAASLRKTGGNSTESTIGNRTKPKRKQQNHTELKRKYEKLKKGNETNNGIQSDQSRGRRQK